jgi:1-phosphatidylinositol-3-phosphate 5-kinase
VKKYQDFLPPNGVQELAKIAFAPQHPVSESDQEYGPVQPRPTVRSKSRHHLPAKKTSMSDFEQGYAANVAPRYLTHPRRTVGQLVHGSRIPVPVGESSFESSRRPSPEKRNSGIETKPSGDSTQIPPPPGSKSSVAVAGGKSGKAKSNSRTRPSPSLSNKSAFRRQTGGPGSKVSNIAKHFERINRDNERANRRYAVIRGKRARPVASARAKVEILDSIKDAIKDESESSDSSEADDEGDGDEPGHLSTNKSNPETSQEDRPVTPEVAPETAPSLPSLPPPTEDAAKEPLDVPHQPPAISVSSPPSPMLPTTRPSDHPTHSPSEPDIGPGTELPSILKAISGLWLQQSRHRGDFEADDPTSDPEHIFRDSSMVVRTDEPTSIIALALKWVLIVDI